MNEIATTRAGQATYQDVLDAPEHMVAELIRGALHPRPESPHARASSTAALRDDAVVRCPPFEAVGFSLSALWVE